MKIEYDFSYLTSPKDPRLDNWIGQHFMLSYFNSEPDTSFSFRYRPYEMIDGLVNGYGKGADRKVSGIGQKRFTSLASRLQNNQTGIYADGGKRTEIRYKHKAISHRLFHGILKETASIVTTLLWMADNERNALPLIDERITSRLQVHKESILEHYNLPIHRKEEILASLQDVEEYVRAHHNIAGDTITLTYKMFSMMELRPESIIIGEWLIGHMKTISEATTYFDLLKASPSKKETMIREYFHGNSTVSHAIQLTTESFGIPIDNLGVMGSYINSERTEIFDSVVGNVSIGIVPNRIGVSGDYITAVDITDTGVIIDITAANKQSSRETHLIDYVFGNGSSHGNEATMSDILYSELLTSTGGVIVQHVVFTNDFGMDVRILEDVTFANYNYLYKDVFIEAVQTYVNIHGADATIDRVMTDVGILEIDALLEERSLLTDKNDGMQSIIGDQTEYVSPMKMDTWTFGSELWASLFPYEGSTYWLSVIGRQPKNIGEIRELHVVNLLQTDANIVDDMLMVNRIDGRVALSEGGENRLVDSLQIQTWIDDEVTYFEGSSILSRIDIPYPIDSMDTEVVKQADVIDEYNMRFTKIHRESWLQHTLLTMTHMEKVALIKDNLDLFKKHSPHAYEFMEQALAIQSESIGQSMIDINAEQVTKELKDSSFEVLFNADRETIDMYLMDLIGANRDDYWDEALRLAEERFAPEPENIGIASEVTISSLETERVAIVQELINAHDSFENSRQGYIMQDGYVLSGDGSDWEDIWKRYSPGVDILDPPDSDFDYETLASKVYRKNTGVPYRAIGATNLPDVKVHTPLHHPLPEHFDLGLDDTRELPVDNYIFIDMVLALESLKNRNTLRYAGMPAEKTVRELFSKLFTWIQQAAPGNAEYDRMFRFCRWYAESVVISLSKHVLHRTYNPWLSSFHEYGDLGIPYTAVNWSYIPSALSTQTTAEHAEYKFTIENYIDGELIIRGYFDNPLNEGTMKIVIDGTLVKTVNRRGPFIETMEVPQGNHTYELIFDGNTGRVSLSTIEISGCEFVSAYTTSDDSDTNGLKACTVLINNLLSYFDKHHGGGKIKGTMEVKQRRVWNAQT